MRPLSLRIIVVAAALAAAASSASAQYSTGSLTFKGDSTSNGVIAGALVGPYKAQFDFNSSFSLATDMGKNAAIWCVDFNHLAPPAGNASDTYAATKLLGNDFSKTRAGSAANYLKAAWLMENSTFMGGSLSDVNVQGTIWKMMSGIAVSGFTDLSNIVPTGNALTLSREWFVLSDIETNNQCTRFQNGCASNQEFMTSRELATTTTPEPSTYVLMAAGLLSMGVVARRRRTAKA